MQILDQLIWNDETLIFFALTVLEKNMHIVPLQNKGCFPLDPICILTLIFDLFLITPFFDKVINITH